MESGKKKVNGYIVTIVILILIILGLIGYIVYDKVINVEQPKQNETVENNKKDEQEKDNGFEIDKKELSTTLLDTFNIISIQEDELYKSTSYNVSQLTNDDLIATAARNMDSEYISYCVAPGDELKPSITIEEFNKSLNELVKDRTITIDMIKNIKEEVSLTAAEYQVGEIGFVVNDDNTINIIGNCGGVFNTNDYVSEKVIDVKVDNDYAYVYVKKAFARFADANEKLIIDFYKDYGKNTIVEKGFDYEELTFDDDGVNTSINWDLYDTYKYTFKKVDGAYYFEEFCLEE